jgi:hypothetical protein
MTKQAVVSVKKLEAKKAKFRKLAARHKLQEYDDKLWKKLNDNNT